MGTSFSSATVSTASTPSDPERRQYTNARRQDYAMPSIAPTEPIQRTATFDRTGQYRYSLSRSWEPQAAQVVFIMLNPSRADAERDDPTIRSCMQFAQRWGYGGLTVVNLFGYRTPSPKCLAQAADPVGAGCDRAILTAAAKTDRIILAWGNWGALLGRDQAVLQHLQPYQDRLYCLGINRTAQPRHPLYIKRTTSLLRWHSSGPTST